MTPMRELKLKYQNNFLEKIRAMTAFHSQWDELIAVMKEESIEFQNLEFTNELDIGVTGDKSVLNKCFKVFRRLGFEPGHRPEEKLAMYSTRFSHDNGCQVWFNFSSSECKMVQVGTKQITQAVYATICNGEVVSPANFDDDIPF